MTSLYQHRMTGSLLHAFLATDYRVYLGDQVFTVRIGQPHPALDDCLDANHWVILSASNPGAELLDERTNRARAKTLEATVGKSGLKTLPTIHHDPSGQWPDESGLLLLDPDPTWVHARVRELAQLGVVAGGRAQVARLWLYCRKGDPGDHPHVRWVQ